MMISTSSTPAGSVVKVATGRFIEIDKWSLRAEPSIMFDADHMEGQPVRLGKLSGSFSGSYGDAATAKALQKVCLKGQSAPLLLKTGDGSAYMVTAFLEAAYDVSAIKGKVTCNFQCCGPVVFYADASSAVLRRGRYRRK